MPEHQAASQNKQEKVDRVRRDYRQNLSPETRDLLSGDLTSYVGSEIPSGETIQKHSSILSRASPDTRAIIARQIQQTYGNTYVRRLIKSMAVQAKLNVNPPDDQYETEADAVADRVVKTAAVQRQTSPEQEVKSPSPVPLSPVEKEIRAYLEANPSLVALMKPEALVERIRQNVPDAASLSSEDISAMLNRWRTQKGLATGLMGLPAPREGVPPPPTVPPKKESLGSSAFEYRLKQVTEAFSKIPTKVEIKPSAGRTITVDFEGVTVKSASKELTQTIGVGWNGAFKLGMDVAGLYKLEGAITPDRYSISLQIGPDVTAIDKLPDVFMKAEQGFRGLISDVGNLNLRNLDAVQASIGQITDHIKPVKTAVDACSKLEPKESSVSFNLTAQFPRGESGGGASVMGMLTFKF